MTHTVMAFAYGKGYAPTGSEVPKGTSWNIQDMHRLGVRCYKYGGAFTPAVHTDDAIRC